MAWNRRYVIYAQSHGRTPEDQRVADRDAYPCAVNLPFILWISRNIQEFEVIHPYAFSYGHALCDHDRFDQWLKQRANQSVAHLVEPTS